MLKTKYAEPLHVTYSEKFERYKRLSKNFAVKPRGCRRIIPPVEEDINAADAKVKLISKGDSFLNKKTGTAKVRGREVSVSEITKIIKTWLNED